MIIDLTKVDDLDVDAFKKAQYTDIVEVAKHYKIIKDTYNITHQPCIFCTSSDAMSLNNNLYTCFSCNTRLSTIDLVAKVENISKYDALQKIQKMKLGVYNASKREDTKEDILNKLTKITNLDTKESNYLSSYFSSINLDVRVVKRTLAKHNIELFMYRDKGYSLHLVYKYKDTYYSICRKYDNKNRVWSAEDSYVTNTTTSIVLNVTQETKDIYLVSNIEDALLLLISNKSVLVIQNNLDNKSIRAILRQFENVNYIIALQDNAHSVHQALKRSKCSSSFSTTYYMLQQKIFFNKYTLENKDIVNRLNFSVDSLYNYLKFKNVFSTYFSSVTNETKNYNDDIWLINRNIIKFLRLKNIQMR